MDLGYTIGDRVIQTEDKVIGEVIRMYYPTACKQQTMIYVMTEEDIMRRLIHSSRFRSWKNRLKCRQDCQRDN